MIDTYTEFLYEFFDSIPGVGESKIAILSSSLNSLKKFLYANKDKLKLLKNEKNHRVLNDEQVTLVLKRRAFLKSDEPLEVALVRVKALNFSRRAKELIEGISANVIVEQGGVNPYMAKALGFKTIDETVEFFVHRRVERSLGTSFGNILQSTLRILSGGRDGKEKISDQGKWIGWWDIVLSDRKVISVKSGPADMDADQVKECARKIEEAESKGYKPYLAFAYGKEAFSVIGSTMTKLGLNPANYIRVGKGVFQEFVGGHYHNEILKVFGEASGEAGDIFALTEEKIKHLTTELNKRFGSDLNKMLAAMF